MATPSQRVTKNLLLILPLLALCIAAAILIPSLFGGTPPVTATTATTATTPATTTTATPPSTVSPTLSPPSPSATYYTVTFSVNGQEHTVRIDTGACAAPLPEDPVLEGYTFIGWTYDDGAQERPYHGEVIASNCILTARFAESAHTVTFAIGADAEALFTEARIASGDAVTDFPRVYKKNRTVSGWYLDAALTAPYTGTPITESTTLYPAYTDYVTGAKTAIPAIHITTEGGVPILSKEDYVRATVTVVGGESGDALSEVGARIRGRGNSTWRFFDKKPYRLKLDAAADLLGLGREKDFVLLANAGDPTMLHNYTFFGLAKLLGDTVTTNATFVSLYLNGEYCGMYLLCEQCEVSEERVPIDEGKSGLADVGYLIEFGGNTQDPPKYSFTLGAVKANGATHAWRTGFYATVKSPDEQTITSAQKSYIKNYLNRVNTAIFSGEWGPLFMSVIRAFAPSDRTNPIIRARLRSSASMHSLSVTFLSPNQLRAGAPSLTRQMSGRPGSSLYARPV